MTKGMATCDASNYLRNMIGGIIKTTHMKGYRVGLLQIGQEAACALSAANFKLFIAWILHKQVNTYNVLLTVQSRNIISS